MTKKYFGFAVADSMFDGSCEISRTVMTAEEVKNLVAAGDVIPCLNPSHQATIDAMRIRYGIDITIPPVAPKVVLNKGDNLLVMSVRGLARLNADRHEYTEDEIASATFSFSKYAVI